MSSDGSSFAPAAPATLLRHRSFVLFWCARTSTTGALQILSVAVGWQLYEMTNNALDLGISGLVQFIPLLALTLVNGMLFLLLRASDPLAIGAGLVLTAAAGTLFWFLVRALARLQMPERRPRRGDG